MNLKNLPPNNRDQIVTSSSHRTKCVLEESLWKTFHKLRSKQLVDIWNDFGSRIHLTLFTGMLPTHVPPPASQLQQPTSQPVDEDCWRVIAILLD